MDHNEQLSQLSHEFDYPSALEEVLRLRAALADANAAKDRVEALQRDMNQWAKDYWVAFNDQARAVMYFADKLEQALKENPHA